MGKKGKAVKRTKQIQEQRGEDEDYKNAPHSFVIHRGKVGRSVINLVSNFRRVMAPYTAEHLKVRNKNILKDFIAIAGPLNVSHLVMFTKSETSVNLRICRLPRGPTLHFQVNSYSLISDLAHHIRKHDVNDSHFKHHALLVMNNFSKDVNHMKLTASMFQNMFPSININKVKLKNIKRVVLVNYDDDTDHIEFRHYHLRVVPLGVSRPVRKLQKKALPKLEKYEDISQFLLNPGALSESEAELDGEHNSVELPQKMSGTANMPNEQSAIRLKEIGPRMTLTLTKITDGVCDGDALYHKFDTLTDEQKQKIQKRKEEKRKLKAQRTAEQNKRIQLKKADKEAERERSRQNQKQTGSKLNVEDGDVDAVDEYMSDHSNNEESDDDYIDDAKYYEMEVGDKPDEGLFTHKKTERKRQRRDDPEKVPPKRQAASPAKGTNKKAANVNKVGGAKFKKADKRFSKATTFTGGAKLKSGQTKQAKTKGKILKNKKR